MRMTHMIIRAIVAATHSHWTRPALVTLVVLADVISVIGCAPPHH
jgi:hypothetical protein